MSRSVDVARCDHEGRDHHRVLPTRRQRCRPLRAAHRRTPRQRRPPPARHRPPAATSLQGRDNLLPVPRGAGTRGPAARLPGFPARAARPPGPGRAHPPPGRAGAPLASPVVLGAHGAAVARRLGLPTVAVYQTDLPSYARAYRFGQAGEAFAWRWLRGIHNGAVRTLAPSTVTATGLLGQGIENVWLWGRGVDTQRFHPAKRSPQIRAEVAPGGELIAGVCGAAGHREASRPAGRDHRTGRGPAGHRRRRSGRGRAAPAAAGCCLPGPAPGRGTRGRLRQPRRVRAQRPTRRSARRCRRRRRAACRWSPRRPEGRST